MNAEDQFEQQLQRQPQRPLPTEWRRELLKSAREASASSNSRLETSLFSKVQTWFSLLLWPNPRAWAGLACLWVIVLFLNLAAREPSRPETVRQMAPSRELRELLRQQEQLFAELAGAPEKPGANRAKTATPRPRSQRLGESMNT